MKRIMTYVVISTIPCILFGWYNTGLQVNSAIAIHGESGWRAAIVALLGVGYGTNRLLGNMFHGALYFFPI